MPNIGDVLQIVVEIDRGGGHSHSNSITLKSAPHVVYYYKGKKQGILKGTKKKKKSPPP